MLENFKIGTRLMIGLLTMALLVSIVSLFSYLELRKVEVPLTQDIPLGLHAIETTSHLDGLAQKIRYYEQILTESARFYAATGDKRWKYRYKNTEPILDTVIKEAINKGDDEDKAAFSNVQKAKLSFVDQEYQAIDAVDRGQKEAALAVLENVSYWQLKEEYKSGLERYIERRGKKYGETLEVTTTQVDSVVQGTHQLVDDSLRLLTMITFFGIVVAVLIGLFVSRSILDPIKKLQKGVEIIGKGNLEHKIKIRSRDEIGQFAHAFNEMTQKLKESYSGLEQKVQDKTRELANKVEEIEKKNQELKESERAILEVLKDLEIAKEKMEKEKVHSEALLASIGEGMIATDHDGKILMMNHQAQLMLGWRAEDAVGRAFMEVIHSEDEMGAPTPLEQRSIPLALASGKQITTAAYYTRKDKTRFPASITVSPVKLDGKVIGTIEIIRDITKEKEVDRMKTEFISTVSHELRTPLTVVREGVSLVIDGILGDVNEKQKKFLCIALEDIDRLKRIIDNLLDISKIEAGKVDLKREPVNVASLVRGVLAAFQTRAQNKGLELKGSFSAEDVETYLDQDKIIQVFTNLIGNAMKFTEAGCITVSLKDHPAYIECTVADTGKGISEEDMTHVFKKFRQFGRTHGAGEKGTGLGLSIAKGIVEIHQGTIRVESKAGTGAKFIFTLPKLTSQDILKECVGGALKELRDQKKPLSVLTFSLDGLDAAAKKTKADKEISYTSHLESAARGSLRRQIDTVIRDHRHVYVVLPSLSKDKAFEVAGRIQESYKQYAAKEGFADQINLFHKVITYPEDGNTYETLVQLAQAA